VNDHIAFFFHAEIPWQFTWEKRFEIELFCFFVNNYIIFLFGFTRALLKLNQIFKVSIKELFKILFYGDRLYLIRIHQWAEFFCWMDTISYYNNIWYVCDMDCLIDSTSNNKWFSLYYSDIDSMINSLSYNMTIVNMSDWCNNVIFNVSIWYNNNSLGIL